MTGKRSRLVTIAAAGTLAVAAAASAVAVTLPSGSSAASAGTADARLAVVNRHQDAARAAQGGTTTVAQDLLLLDRARTASIERLRAHDAAAARSAARKAATARAAAAAAQQSGIQLDAAQQPAASVASGASQQTAEQMLSQFGWSASQFSCLQPLWQRESGWNVTAENPSSGAYGIPQALPGSKMASVGADWQTDAATQIRWGLTYIQGTYGSPCGAWAHEQADGWY
jgi:hypothetical protein